MIRIQRVRSIFCDTYQQAILVSILLLTSLLLSQSLAYAAPGDEHWDDQFFMNGLDGQVNALAIDGDGNLYVGGSFTMAGSEEANNIAKWDGISWSALGDGMDAGVRALVIDNDGSLYAGGSFTMAGGKEANYIAKWDGTKWSALGDGMDAGVLSLVIDNDGNLYAGGTFTMAGGSPASYIAKWDGTSWSALGSGIYYPWWYPFVSSLAVGRNNILYVGGRFNKAGDVVVSNIAGWDGSAWFALGSGLEGDALALAIDSSHNIYAGGAWPGTYFRGYLAKWDGSSWSPILSSSGIPSPTIRDLVIDDTGHVYAGGYQEPYNHIAKWDGTRFSSLGSGVDNSVNALAIDSNGDLFIGGNFTTAGGKESNRIARWIDQLSPEIDLQGNGQSIPNGDETLAVANDTDFGTLDIENSVMTHTFTISNSGFVDLILTETPPVSLAIGTDFTVTQQPTSPVISNSTTTFQITFDPSAAGTFTDTVTIANNDPNENPYTFVISGKGMLNSQPVHLPVVLNNYVAPTPPTISNARVTYLPFEAECFQAEFVHGFKVHFDFIDPNGDADDVGSEAIANPSGEMFEAYGIGVGLISGDRFSGQLVTQTLCLELTPPDTSLTISFWLNDYHGTKSNTLIVEVTEDDFFNVMQSLK